MIMVAIVVRDVFRISLFSPENIYPLTFMTSPPGI
jgi:hypothetical protein